MDLSWTKKQWRQLATRAIAGNLPHGLILHGLAGLGKTKFAVAFAKYLLCESPQGDEACGQCRACSQFESKTHPDFIFIEPEETGKNIKVGQIRELITELSLATHYGRYRIAIIRPADNMNAAAANSLLKSLEEPPPETVLFLITDRMSTLLPTIKSRCQHILFQVPDELESTNWLKNNHNISGEKVAAALALAHGAPLAAAKLIESDELVFRDRAFEEFYAIGIGKKPSLPLSDAWLKPVLPEPINWLYSWVADLVRLKCQPEAGIRNSDKSENLHKLAQHVELGKILIFLDSLASQLRLKQVPLNPQMTMEYILVHWQTLSSGQKTG